MEEHAGVLPSDPAALQRLPGVGRYTAGAVACFAYEQVAATVDTNVARVIRRAFHPRLGGRSAARLVWSTALAILPKRGKLAWEVNQALMELGAVICTPRRLGAEQPMRPRLSPGARDGLKSAASGRAV